MLRVIVIPGTGGFKLHLLSRGPPSGIRRACALSRRTQCHAIFVPYTSDPSGNRPAARYTERMADPTEVLLEDVPVLAVRDVVLYPGAMLPITVGRPSSVALVQRMGGSRSLCVMHRAIRVPRDNLLLFCEGTTRIRIREFTATEPFLRARIEKLEEIDPAITPEVEPAAAERGHPVSD